MPYANLSAGPVYYEWRGPALSSDKAGRLPVIFFNGWCLSARYWEETARRLEKEWPLLLFDGRGFGRSNPLTHHLPPDYPVTIENGALEAEKLVSSYGFHPQGNPTGRVSSLVDGGAKIDPHTTTQTNQKPETRNQKLHVVGHSLGGVTAAHFAAWAEAQGRLASLTIINSGSFEPNARQGSSLSFFVNIFVQTKNLFDLPLIRRSVVARSVNQPIAEREARVITRDFVQADRRAALELSRSSLAMPNLKRYRRELEELKARLLLIVGDKDATIPPAGMYNIKRFKPESQLVAFQDCGHLPMLERAERFAETLAAHFTAAEHNLEAL